MCKSKRHDADIKQYRYIVQECMYQSSKEGEEYVSGNQTAERSSCSYKGCTNKAVKGGVCIPDMRCQ